MKNHLIKQLFFSIFLSLCLLLFSCSEVKNTVTIAFNNNCDDECTGTMKVLIGEVGTEVFLPVNQFARKGYIFTGWNLASDGSGIYVEDGAKIMLKKDFVLYAMWGESGIGHNDIYYVLEPVKDANPADNTRDILVRYFEFTTNESVNESSGIFVGTSVYYKIYNNLSTLTSEATSITNSNSEYTENGYNRMISLGYKRMGVSTNLDPLIELGDSSLDRGVKIRLYTEGEASGDPYQATVTVGNVPLMDGSEYAIPLRSDGVSTFDFFPDNVSQKKLYVNGKAYNTVEPVSTDEDVKITESSETSDKKVWYVNAYVVSVGRTPTFTLKYSALTSLGYLEISENNK